MVLASQPKNAAAPYEHAAAAVQVWATCGSSNPLAQRRTSSSGCQCVACSLRAPPVRRAGNLSVVLMVAKVICVIQRSIKCCGSASGTKEKVEKELQIVEYSRPCKFLVQGAVPSDKPGACACRSKPGEAWSRKPGHSALLQ